MLSLFLVSCGGGGGGGSSRPNTAPLAPGNILSVGGNTQARLSWGDVSGATTYNIYYSTTTGVAKKTGTKISAVTSPYYHNGLNNGTTYYYVVTAENQYGESGESIEVSATPSLTNPPLPPMNIATLAFDRQVVIRWTEANMEDVSISHNIYWSTTSGVTKINGTRIDYASSPYTHADLINGSTYYYVVTSINDYGESIESQEVSATPDQGNFPSPATGVIATAGDRQASISWNIVDNALGYNIYWSTSSDVSSKNGTQIADVMNPYTHIGLQQGSTYYYVITAVNGYGESADSDRVSVAIPDYLNDVCVALGDSITVGAFIDNYADTYVPRLSAAWGKTIYNKGVLGTLSSYGANVIDSILAQYNPKYITIFYGTNDNGYFNTDLIIGNLRYMIRSAKANGTKPVIATLTPVFGQWAWRKPSLINLNQRIRQLASEEGINCADLEAAFGWNADYILSDGLHPNSTGHRIIANTFYNALTR